MAVLARDGSHTADGAHDVPHVAVVSVVVVVAVRLGTGLGKDIAVVSVLSKLKDLVIDVLSAGSATSGPKIVGLRLFNESVSSLSGISGGEVTDLSIDLIVEGVAGGVLVSGADLAVSVERVKLGEIRLSGLGEGN